jgi:molybdopterin converting factor small subunit
MTVTVRTFARYRDLLGFDRLALPLPEPPVLGALLADPRLAHLPEDALLAVNQAFADRWAALAEGDEVALMPPVSGG